MITRRMGGTGVRLGTGVQVGSGVQLGRGVAEGVKVTVGSEVRVGADGGLVGVGGAAMTGDRQPVRKSARRIRWVNCRRRGGKLIDTLKILLEKPKMESYTKYIISQEESMPALNRVQLIGYLGKDPETRFTPTGKKVTHFSIAVTQRWKTAGEAKEYTDWIYIEAWGRLGEICDQYLHKGSLVYLEGRLKTERYEEKGETKYITKVVALLLQMLDRKSADEPVLTVEDEAGEYEA